MRIAILAHSDLTLRRLLRACQGQGQGHQVIATKHSRDLLSIAQLGPIDAAIVDLWTPELGGVEVIRVLTLLFDPPVLGYTEVADAEQLERAIAAGADRVVSDHSDSDALIADVLAWIAKVDAEEGTASIRPSAGRRPSELLDARAWWNSPDASRPLPAPYRKA